MLLRYFTILLVANLCHGAIESLKPLPNGKLATKEDRLLPNNRVLTPNTGAMVTAQATQFHQPSSVLRPNIFSIFPFTAGPASLNIPVVKDQSLGDLYRGTEARFIVAEVKATYNKEEIKMYALQVAPEGERGYWVPQGGYVDIPRSPGSNEPKLVFTPDFSGCSLTITPIANDKYRVIHVEGDKEDKQFNDFTEAQLGGTVTYAMQYKDYGYHTAALSIGEENFVNNRNAFAFLNFTNGNWELNYQILASPPTLAGFRFDAKTKHLSTMFLNQPIFRGNTATGVAGMRSYIVPNPSLGKIKPGDLAGVHKKYIRIG